MPEKTTLDSMARDWLAAREVIVAFLRELRPDMSRDQHQHNAGALIARLASHEPPILLTTAGE